MTAVFFLLVAAHRERQKPVGDVTADRSVYISPADTLASLVLAALVLGLMLVPLRNRHRPDVTCSRIHPRNEGTNTCRGANRATCDACKFYYVNFTR